MVEHMVQSRFYKDKLCLNVLAKDIDNAKEIYEVTEGHVLIGLLSTHYQTVDEAVQDIGEYQKELGGAISLGLGAGDPRQWKIVAEICRTLKLDHVNQVFSAVGYTRACLQNETTLVNGLVNPVDQLGYVNVATGPLTSTGTQMEIPLTTAISFIKEMGGNSVKLFPLDGLQTREQYKRIAHICAKEDFPLEPTGGIDLQNFEEIVTIALQAGVTKVIPHVYSSIIDKDTGRTRVEDVKKLYDIIKRVVVT